MRAGIVLWWVTLAEIALAGLALSAGAWSGWAQTGSPAEGDYLAAIETSTALVNLAFVMHVVAFGWALPIFVGPTSRIRDLAAAGLRSHTGRWFLISAALTGSLQIALWQPASVAQFILTLCLFAALTIVWILVLHGLRMIARTDRREAYFEGMSEREKRLADNPWPALATPGYLDIDHLNSADDADRYAHRAADAARMHDWIGGGIMVLSTALLGAAVSRFFEASEPTLWIWVAVSLLGVGLGYAVQLRGRAYHRLRESYEKASAELTSLDNAHPTPWRDRFGQSMRVLFGRG